MKTRGYVARMHGGWDRTAQTASNANRGQLRRDHGSCPDRTRRGAIIPLVALCAILLMVMLALAIDIGMIAIARSQCQNAADAAAMAGARTFNGDSSSGYNLNSVPVNAVKAATVNNVLGVLVNGNPADIKTVNGYTFSSGNVTVATGAYSYLYDDVTPANEKFVIQFPKTDSTEPYSAVRATVQGSGSYAFGRVLGLTAFNTQATAVAVHRPRDVVIIMDLSGSMRFQSLPGTYVASNNIASGSTTSQPRTHSLNPETVYPVFGHYSSNSAGLFGNTSYSTGTEMIDPANISTSSNSGPPIAEDFYANAFGVSPSATNRAFARTADSKASAPGGDNYLKNNWNASATYAKTVSDITGSSNDQQLAFENYGYEGVTGSAFNGYVEGPGYWGKTFFIWPPDPGGSSLSASNSANHANNGARDWRQRFFFKYRSSDGQLSWLDDTRVLFAAGGVPATGSNFAPGDTVLNWPNRDVSVNGTNYQWRPNYAAILHWIRTNPQHFPSQLRAGRIKYYDAIPNPSDTSLNSRWWSNYNLTNLNERFWREYIDFVLGIICTGNGQWSRRNVSPEGSSLSSVPMSAMIGNGDYFQWGTVQISGKPSVSVFQTGNVNNTSGYAVGAGYSSNINVKNLPSSPDVAVGYYVKFGNHDTLYRVTSRSTNSSGVVTTVRITSGNSSGLDVAVSNNTSMTFYASMPRYMDPDDNPYRPRHQLWFGPMTFIDFLGNYNTTRFWWPGNVHEAQAWACKVGIQTAIDDIKKNHPADFIGMAFFSSPKYSSSDSGQHNTAVVPLGRNYNQLKDSLWFPPSTVTGGVTEITPYDEDFDNVPRAKGGTAPAMGFMISYNLLSSSVSNLRTYAQPQPTYRGVAGGLGRKGANRLVIFETDGAPNTQATASLGGSGSDSYYQVRVKYPLKSSDNSNEWPSGGSYSDNTVYNVVKQICALETASPPGYSTNRKPVLVYSLGYGSLFDPANTSTTQSDALGFLQTIQYHGNTATDTNGTNFPNWQRIYGTNDQRIERMRVAFTTIMQSGIQVSLIE